jgi:ADP-ribose pyrophosphatase YjhB (NUDIX family)
MPHRSLRLGVLTAAFDTRQHLLLSRRADLDVWTLPGGRLDEGERLEHAAAREVEEETGIEVAAPQPIGLYYMAGWRRMNILFAARVRGGALRAETDETRDNGFFSPDEARLMLGAHRPDAQPTTALPVLDALSNRRPPPRLMTLPTDELRRLRFALGRRYVANWLRGKPEPRYPVFDCHAVALVWDETHRRLLTLKQGMGRMLPRMRCDGAIAPWQALASGLERACKIGVALHWVGIWQDASLNRLEFVFAATVKEMPLFRTGEWTTARNAALPARDTQYIERVKANYAHAPVWMLEELPYLT